VGVDELMIAATRIGASGVLLNQHGSISLLVFSVQVSYATNEKKNTQ
jgi:hypothetical protein